MRLEAGVLDITIAGYSLDHVRALAEGRVQVEGCNTTFKPGKIGDLNTHVFDGPQKLEVTEIGLSPFMLAYANQGFRDYSLIPVFPLRLFRQPKQNTVGIQHETMRQYQQGASSSNHISLVYSLLELLLVSS